MFQLTEVKMSTGKLLIVADIFLCPTLEHSATFDVQDVKLHGGTRNISIRCVFASGSQARGCHVEIRNSSIQRNIARRQSEQTVAGLTPGSYEVFVFDWESDDTFPSTPSYVGHIIVTNHLTHVNISEVDNPTTSILLTTGRL